MNPVGAPTVQKVEYGKDTSIKFNFVVERSPEFKVKNYTKINVEEIVRCKDEDVTKELETLLERYAQLTPSLDITASKKHFAIISYRGGFSRQGNGSAQVGYEMINLSSPQSIEDLPKGLWA